MEKTILWLEGENDICHRSKLAHDQIEQRTADKKVRPILLLQEQNVGKMQKANPAATGTERG